MFNKQSTSPATFVRQGALEAKKPRRPTTRKQDEAETVGYRWESRAADRRPASFVRVSGQGSPIPPGLSKVTVQVV